MRLNIIEMISEDKMHPRLMAGLDSDQLNFIMKMDSSYPLCPTCGGDDTEGVYVDSDGDEAVCRCLQQRYLNWHYLLSGIPVEFYRLGSWDWNEDRQCLELVERWFDKMEVFVERGCGLALTGDPGLGKTFSMALLAKWLIRGGGYPVFFTRAEAMVSLFKDTWDNDPQKKRRFERGVYESQFLFIDDLGREYGTEFTKWFVDQVIRTRAQERKPTFFTSNFKPGELEKSYGSAAWSLIQGRMVVREVTGADYRRTVQSRDNNDLFDSDDSPGLIGRDPIS